MTIHCYNGETEYLEPPESIDECVNCGEDWFDARTEFFGSKEDAAPYFKSVVSPTDIPGGRLSQMVWGIRCYSCGESYVQVMTLSSLFKVNDNDT